MAIKSVLPSKEGQKVTPKKWVKEVVWFNLDGATDWYYERHEAEWDQMTEREQQEVTRQMQILHARIEKMLQK